jgi:hypothetical protein
LTENVSFDLAGVFRRRRLAPFVMIPRHVSGRYGTSDPLSLMARLQQAQEAFVCGIPLAAFALMREETWQRRGSHTPEGIAQPRKPRARDRSAASNPSAAD